MSYASKLGLTVGSKIKIIDPSKEVGSYSDGDILELTKDDRSRTPVFHNLTTGQTSCCFTIQDRTDNVTWEHYKEDEKEMAHEAKPKTPFEEAGYTKDTVLKVVSCKGGVQHNFDIGTEVKLNHDDNSESPDFRSISDGIAQYVSLVDLEEVVVKELKFPCCVPLSKIKDQDTFDKIFALFIASGARAYETDYEEGKSCDYNYFGADYDKDTIFYGYLESYSFNDEGEDVTIYSVADLLAMLPKEEQAVVEPAVPTLFPVGTEVKIAETSEYYTYGTDGNPINIKGVITANNSSSDHVYHVKWDNGRSNVYKLEDLVLWNEGWIEWNGDSESPVPVGTKLDIKYGDGVVSTNIGNQDDSTGEGTGRTCTSWKHWTGGQGADIVAYRLHKPSVVSQETITDVLESKPSVNIDLGKSNVEASTEPTYPKIGGKIKITGNENCHRFGIGEIVTVVEDCSDESTPNWRCPNKEDLSYVESGWVYVGEFELVDGVVPQESSTEAQPLVTIVKDVTYTVTIKGIQLSLTQDELNELSIELDGFEDYE